MTEKIAFISGCDSNYYAMLCEWIASVRQFKQAENIDICIINGGLDVQHVQALESLGCKVVSPDWPAKLPVWKVRGREFLKCCVCRPFIPKLFPGYDLYMWMDADTWIQDWRAIEIYLEGARRGKLAITSQGDRGYLRQIRVKWLGPFPWKVRTFYYTNALAAFGGKLARKILPFHVLNAGSFALAGNAPHWNRWQELLLQALQKGKVFTAEQLTLGVLTYLENYPAEILPAWTQWLCENKPHWDKKRKLFVEPFLPNEVIGIVHVSGFDEMRRDRSVLTEIPCTDGTSFQGTLRFSP
ncbi:MAG TPA: hypothetical protein PLO23_06490 [Alphaproteobacteria bacterium]|nr:hypothetical protein [Alphaproteobacteria bacterium]